MEKVPMNILSKENTIRYLMYYSKFVYSKKTIYSIYLFINHANIYYACL